MKAPRPVADKPAPQAARVASELLRGWLREGGASTGVNASSRAPDPKAEVRPPRK